MNLPMLRRWRNAGNGSRHQLTRARMAAFWLEEPPCQENGDGDWHKPEPR